MPEATIGGVIQVDAGSKLFSPRIGPLSEPAARIANFDWVRYIPDFTFVEIFPAIHAAAQSVGETVVVTTALQVHG
jgi:hypothetical protein